MTHRFLAAVAVFIAALLVFACGTTQSVSNEDEAHVAARLWEGYDRYVAACGACHELIEPASLSDAAWTSTVRDMAPRADVSPREAETILAYLQWANDSAIADTR